MTTWDDLLEVCEKCGDSYPNHLSHCPSPSCNQQTITFDEFVGEIKDSVKSRKIGGLATIPDFTATSTPKVKKKRKARSKKRVYKGITFDSKNEETRYIYLEKLELAGIISNLNPNPKSYELHRRLEAPKNRLRRKFEKGSGGYTPDFIYNWQEFLIFEDTKVYDWGELSKKDRFVPHVEDVATLRHNIYRATIVYTKPNQEFFLTAFDKKQGRWRYFFNGKKELVDFSLENE